MFFQYPLFLVYILSWPGIGELLDWHLNLIVYFQIGVFRSFFDSFLVKSSNNMPILSGKYCNINKKLWILEKPEWIGNWWIIAVIFEITFLWNISNTNPSTISASIYHLIRSNYLLKCPILNSEFINMSLLFFKRLKCGFFKTNICLYWHFSAFFISIRLNPTFTYAGDPLKELVKNICRFRIWSDEHLIRCWRFKMALATS